MTLDEFVSKCFEDHGDDAAGVFDRLPSGFALVSDANHLPSFAHLIQHVSGEHLGRWSDGVTLLEKLERLPVFDAATPHGKAVFRAQAVLHRCAGHREEEARCMAASRTGGAVLPASDEIRVLALTAQAFLAQRRFDEAWRDFSACAPLASYGPTKADPAARALAAMGNGVAVELEKRDSLTDTERTMMLAAAALARVWWAVAGGWMEIERAEYRLAMSHVKAGMPAAALRHAEACRKIVVENGADPGEMFFAHEALAHASRVAGDSAGARRELGAMSGLLPTVADESFRSYCAEQLAKLDAKVASD